MRRRLGIPNRDASWGEIPDLGPPLDGSQGSIAAVRRCLTSPRSCQRTGWKPRLGGEGRTKLRVAVTGSNIADRLIPQACRRASTSLSATSWAAAPRGLVGAQGSDFRIVAIFQARSLSILKESFDGLAFPPTLRELDQGPLRVLLGGLLGVNWPVDPVDSPRGPHGSDAMSEMASFCIVNSDYYRFRVSYLL